MRHFFLTYTPLRYLFQSLWRDESFSVLMASHPIKEILFLTANEFNSPLYYLMLFVWIRLFGSSEVSIRLLSFIPHLLLSLIIFHFIRSVRSKKEAFFAALVIFLNPMLLLYAFEARGYSWFALFATLSSLALYKKQWKIYIVATILGLYTHAYMLLVLVFHLCFLGFLTRRKRHKYQTNGKDFFLSLGIVFTAYSPWLPILFHQWRASSESWIYPVDLQLILSTLGNLFTSYEGTPAGLWGWTALLSLILLFSFFLALKKDQELSPFLFFWIAVPLIIILGASFIKPLYVNRYLIFIPVAESLLLVYALLNFSQRFRRYLYGLIIIFLVTVNIFRARFADRFDSRNLFQTLGKSSSIPIYVDALFYFDSWYYYPYRDSIYVYRLPGTHVPAYVGTALIPESRVHEAFPSSASYVYIDPQGRIFTHLLK